MLADLAFILTLLAFIAISVAYVRGLDRIVRPGGVPETHDQETT